MVQDQNFRYGIFDIFTSTQKKIETSELIDLANQPVTISPLVWVIPVVAVGLFAVIYLVAIRK